MTTTGACILGDSRHSLRRWTPVLIWPSCRISVRTIKAQFRARQRWMSSRDGSSTSSLIFNMAWQNFAKSRVSAARAVGCQNFWDCGPTFRFHRHIPRACPRISRHDVSASSASGSILTSPHLLDGPLVPLVNGTTSQQCSERCCEGLYIITMPRRSGNKTSSFASQTSRTALRGLCRPCKMPDCAGPLESSLSCLRSRSPQRSQWPQRDLASSWCWTGAGGDDARCGESRTLMVRTVSIGRVKGPPIRQSRDSNAYMDLDHKVRPSTDQAHIDHDQ